MKKKITITLLTALLKLTAFAQTTALPLKEWNSTADTPFVLYITGDGGFNSFSTNLCMAINKAGYAVSAINAKSYFWDKKSPEQTAADISAFLQKKIAGKKVVRLP